jgi:predicted nucleic acid-binding protein
MNSQDPYYAKARSLFLDLNDLERSFVTTNSIIFDLHEWLRNDYGYEQADYFLSAIDKAMTKDKLEVIPSGPEFEGESRRLLIDRPELRFSLSEALTAVTLSYYQIKRIFTFNRNFIMLSNLEKDIRIIPYM